MINFKFIPQFYREGRIELYLLYESKMLLRRVKMTDNMNKRNVPVASINQKDEWPQGTITERTSTKNMWRLYYYMLSRSAVAWNDTMGFRPTYFLSKQPRYWSQSKAAKDLGVTAKTLKSNLNRLIDNHLIIPNDKGFTFTALKYYYPLHLDLIETFCSLDNSKDWELMIRFYSVLCYAFKGGFASFTLTDIIETLSIRKGQDSRAKLLLYLQWWRELELLDYVVERKYCAQTQQSYSLYNINFILDKPSEKMYKEFISEVNDNEVATSFDQNFNSFTVANELVIDYETGEVLM